METMQRKGETRVAHLDRDRLRLIRDRGLAFLIEHDLFRKPVPTFRDHALALAFAPQNRARGRNRGRIELQFGGKGQEIRLVGHEVIEHGGQEGRVAGRLPDRLRTEAGQAQEPAQPLGLGRDKRKRAHGEGFGLLARGPAGAAGLRFHYPFCKEYTLDSPSECRNQQAFVDLRVLAALLQQSASRHVSTFGR